MASGSEFSNVAEAARLQYSHVVAEMLAAGEDVNAQDSTGRTALHWSCLLGLDSLTSLILAHDARVDIVDHSGRTACHCAALARSVTSLRMLSAEKSSHGTVEVFLQEDSAGRTPLQIAAEQNDAATMEWFYLQGVNLEHRDRRGRTPLMLACLKGHLRAVQWLLSRHVSVVEIDNDGRTALHLAAAAGHMEVIKILVHVLGLPALHEPDPDGRDILAIARKNEHWPLCLWLIRARVCEALAGIKDLRDPDSSVLVRDLLSQSVWAQAFWVLVLVNFATFLFIVGPATWQEHLLSVWLWFFLLCCVTAFWSHLSWSDPGFVADRLVPARAGLDQEDIFEVWRLPVDDQVVYMAHIEPEKRPLHQDEVEDGPSRNGSPGSGPSPRTGVLEEIQRQWREISRRQQLSCALQQWLQAGTLARGDKASLLQGRFLGSSPEERQQVADALRSCDEKLHTWSRELIRHAGPLLLKEAEKVQGKDYTNLVSNGEFRTICVMCHKVRAARCFHCKNCGSCVQRLDHHCPWLDRCIGLGNQRSFYVFLYVLLAALLEFEHLCTAFLADEAASLASIVVVVAVLIDLSASLFVMALIVRQTVFMVVNITTYEVLVCPPHVRQRFPSRSSRLWFLADFSLQSARRSVTSYWQSDMSKDSADFCEDGSWTDDAWKDLEQQNTGGFCFGAPVSQGYHQHSCEPSCAQLAEATQASDQCQGHTRKSNSRTVVYAARASL